MTKNDLNIHSFYGPIMLLVCYCRPSVDKLVSEPEYVSVYWCFWKSNNMINSSGKCWYPCEKLKSYPLPNKGPKGKRKVCFRSDVLFYVCNYFKNESIRGRNPYFSHICKVYRLLPLIVSLITYCFTYITSRLYCIIPCFIPTCSIELVSPRCAWDTANDGDK